MGIQLKPCPFCGNEAAFKVGYHMTVDVKVGCDECGAEGPVFGTDANSGDFRPKAADAWNRRTDEESTRLRAELAAKSKEVEALRDGLEAVYQYGSDTLRGPTGDTLDDRSWQRQAVLEMTNRASRTIDSGSWKGEGNGR